MIKQLYREAELQSAVFAAFEKEGWPERIDNPLKPDPDVLSKQRIRDTVKNLNRRLKPGTVRFYTDGQTAGFRWRRVSKAKRNDTT